MKVMKAFLSVLFVFSIIVVAACSTDGGNSGSSTGQTEANGSTNPEGSGNDEEMEHLQLSFFLPGDADTVMPRGDADFVKKTIEEKFNVSIDLETMPAGNEFNTRLTLLISSGDAPDLMATSGSLAAQLNEDGVMADLKPYLNPEEMPNLFKWVTQEEVDAFQLAGLYTRGPIPVNPVAPTSYFIRKDWLDHLNLELPTNYEELTEVMRAFTEEDPDNNGRNDTYGFSAPGSGSQVNVTFPQYKHHGLYAPMFVDPETKNFKTSYTEVEVGAVLDDIRVWMDAGYVDPDWYLSQGPDVMQKFAQGRIGMVWADIQSMLEANPNSDYNQLKELFPEAEMIAFTPFPGTPNMSSTSMASTWSVSQSTAEQAPEKVERIIQIVDWLLSEEGFLMTQFGLEGEHYTREGNTITTNPEAFVTDVIEQGNFLAAWDALTPYQYWEPLGLDIIDPTMSERDKEMLDTVASYPVVQGVGTAVVPPEHVDWGSFTSRRSEIMVQYLFEKNNYPVWEDLLIDWLENYYANDVYLAYTEQMQAANVDVNLWEPPVTSE